MSQTLAFDPEAWRRAGQAQVEEAAALRERVYSDIATLARFGEAAGIAGQA